MMSAACRATPATLSAPFVNNQLDPSLWNPLARQMMNMVPVADPAFDVNGCGRYLLNQANNEVDRQYVTRVDYQMTANKRVFFRDFIATNDHPAAWNSNKPNLLDITSNGRGLDGPRAHGRDRSGLGHHAAPGRVDALLVPAHVRAPSQQRGLAELGAARRERLELHEFHRRAGQARAEQESGSGLHQRRAVERRVHRRVLRRHALVHAELRLAEGRPQPTRGASRGRARIRTATARSPRTAAWASPASSRAARTRPPAG